ncbi:IS1-like element transposase [Fastidiosibacter lacustris]|uniref:IS1-like element transposase n=1 Tax=Fastidiosibacter lacustris TaxID=2056695 RepID=UPI001300AD6F|nr:IS1-like element transposase [Fastidiosibacter lacustris]
MKSSPNGAQRYRCLDCSKYFQLEYKALGRLPKTKERIIDMCSNGSGIRDTARVLKVSTKIFVFLVDNRHTCINIVTKCVKQTMRGAMDLSISGKFNNSLWRSILEINANELSKQMGINIEVISPFGFEVTNKKTLLSKKLRKFYAYLGINKVDENQIINLKDISTAYGELLLAYLEKYHKLFYEDIIIKVYQDGFIKLRSFDYIPQDSDKLIDVQTRITKNNIYQDYADYIICCLSALAQDKDEPAMFSDNVRHRVRTIQLYIMLENIFGHLIYEMTENQKSLYMAAFSKIDNSLGIFTDSSLLNIKASDDDVQIMLDLIKPRVSEIVKVLKQGHNTQTIESRSYHVSGKLKLELTRKHYNNAINFITQTYQEFI